MLRSLSLATSKCHTQVPLTSSIKMLCSHLDALHSVLRSLSLAVSRFHSICSESHGAWLWWCTVHRALFGTTVRHRHTLSTRAPATRTVSLHIIYHASLPQLPLPSS